MLNLVVHTIITQTVRQAKLNQFLDHFMEKQANLTNQTLTRNQNMPLMKPYTRVGLNNKALKLRRVPQHSGMIVFQFFYQDFSITCNG